MFWEALEKAEKVCHTDDQQQACKVFEDMIEDLLKPLLKQSCDTAGWSTFTVWTVFLDIIEILLVNVRAAH